MSANPFGERVAELMAAKSGCVTETTYKTTEARLKRIERDMLRMKEQGKISSMSPAKMTPEDIKSYIVERKEKGVGASDISHDISALKQLCTMCGNTCVQNCLTKYTGLKPTCSKEGRLAPLPDKTYEAILAKYNTLDHTNYSAIRPYALVLLYICTGARNKELRLAEVSDLDTEVWQIYLKHVKGEKTWGKPRPVPIPEIIRPVVLNFLNARENFLKDLGVPLCDVPTLFCSMYGEHGPLSGNTIRKLKSYVERDVGQKFELRDCRRAFGQHYLDNDAELEDVSKLMGHKTTQTTETYYCGRRISKAIANVEGKW